MTTAAILAVTISTRENRECEKGQPPPPSYPNFIARRASQPGPPLGPRVNRGDQPATPNKSAPNLQIAC